ncbi:hypothetical protein [Streptomyces sp. TRM49041]|nr:hypothetical protein [Streptomyces sp. TRM49041]
MDTYDEGLHHKIDAWVREQLTASPEWEPEQYITIRQHLEGDAPPREAGA